MSEFADASDQVREIEQLSNPSPVAAIKLPDLGLTDSEYAQAKAEIRDIQGYVNAASDDQNFKTITALLATVKRREHQLTNALQSLAVSNADLNDSHQIIKQWRAHFGYTSDEHGKITYAVN